MINGGSGQQIINQQVLVCGDTPPPTNIIVFTPTAGPGSGSPNKNPTCHLIPPSGDYNVGPNAIATFQPAMALALTSTFHFLNIQWYRSNDQLWVIEMPLINSECETERQAQTLRRLFHGIRSEWL